MERTGNLMDDLRAVLADAEELLRATAGEAAPKVQEARARAEETLKNARERLEGGGRRGGGHRPAGRRPARTQMSTGLIESAQNLLAGLLDLGRTRFELFGTELREELARLATTVLGGLAVLMLAGLGLAFGAMAFILNVSEDHRVLATLGVAALFLIVAVIMWAQLRRIIAYKTRAFDATISELARDLDSIRP